MMDTIDGPQKCHDDKFDRLPTDLIAGLRREHPVHPQAAVRTAGTRQRRALPDDHGNRGRISGRLY
jgi:hypothetical protein